MPVRAYGIYSDDHGTTWHTGFDQQDTTGDVQLLEGTLAELPTGKLFISFRDKHPGAKTGAARQYAFSSDGGATLAGPFVKRPLKIVSVQGSALALTGTHSNLLLFSAPADPTVTLRRDLTVFASTTSGATWNKATRSNWSRGRAPTPTWSSWTTPRSGSCTKPAARPGKNASPTGRSRSPSSPTPPWPLPA